MFYSSKNCAILINGLPIIANEASILVSNKISPSTHINNLEPSYFVPENGVEGVCRLSYYITGFDFIKDLVLNPGTNLIQGNFGGLSFSSGVMSSYSMDISPNSPVKVDSEIYFFDNLNGSFIPSYGNLEKKEIINFSDSDIVCSFLDPSFITKITYKANIDFSVSYKDSDQKRSKISPDIIFSNQRKTFVEVYCDNMTGNISESGSYGILSITLNNKNGSSVEDIYVSGLIVSKEIIFSDRNPISVSYSLRQDNLSDISPEISGFSPLISPFNGLVTISGSNMKSFTSLTYAGTTIDNARYSHTFSGVENIVFNLDSLIQSGLISINSPVGKATTTNFLSLSSGEIGEF